MILSALAFLPLLGGDLTESPRVAPENEDRIAIGVWLGAVQDEVEALLDETKELLRRNPLRYHVEAYEKLAEAEEEEALAALRKLYKKPMSPKEQERYLLATAFGEKGAGEELMDELDDWRKEFDDPSDAWLWRNTLAVDVEVRGPERALEIARTHKKVIFRAAAIEALAASKDESLYELLPELAKAMPKKPVEKQILMGALATALGELGNKKSRVEREWKTAALSLIAQLDGDELPRAGKLVLARYLARVLESDDVVLNGNAWRALISERSREEKERKKKKKKAGEDKKKKSEPEYVRPSFFGVEVTGNRVCYLIDLSDSMAEPIPEEWRKRGPMSGGKEAKRKKGALPTVDDIPWHSVETRYDLAREHIKISLQRLQPDQFFTVIGFGTRAEFFDGSKGMVKASKGNVKKVLKELEGIEIGPPQGTRKFGTLWGDTNLHSGIRLAFSVTKKGAVDEFEYVMPETFEHGADTIFILSDGDPSLDDYTRKDVDYGDGQVFSDREAGERSKERTRELNYLGPYAHWKPLLDDVRRMNMLREIEIHVIGIGDADENALKALADIGLGKVELFGKS